MSRSTLIIFYLLVFWQDIFVLFFKLLVVTGFYLPPKPSSGIALYCHTVTLLSLMEKIVREVLLRSKE